MNPLRHETTYHVSRTRLEAIRDTMEELSMDPPEDGDSLRFLRNRFVLSETPGVKTEPNADDMEAIGMVVRNASRQADYTIVTIHAHEGDGSVSCPRSF